MTIVEKITSSKATVPEISVLTGIPSSRMYKWIKGVSNPKPKDISLLESFFRDISSLTKEQIKLRVAEKGQSDDIDDAQMAPKAAILEGLIQALDISVAKFERKIGVTSTSISKAIDRNSSIKDDTVRKIKTAFPQVNENWLLTGDGEMFISASSKQSQQPHNQGFNAQTDFSQSAENESTIDSLSTGDQIRRRKAIGTEEDERGLIYVPIAAQAGYSRHFMDNVYLNQLDRLFIPGLPYKGDNYRYFDVEGDSMEPTMQEGMQVIAEKVETENWKHIRNYYVYVVVFIDRIAIKRLYKKDERSIVLISDNEALYQQELAKIEEIKELWLVKRKIDWNIMPPKQFEIKL